MIGVDCEWSENPDEYFLLCATTGVTLRSKAAARAWIEGLPASERLVGHYFRNDLREIGAYPPCPVLDTGTLSWLSDENPPHGLKHLARRYLGRELVDPITTKAKRVLFDGVPIATADQSRVERYCHEDAQATLDLWYRLWPTMDLDTRRWFNQVEGPVLDRRLWEVEQQGVMLDQQGVADLTREFQAAREQERLATLAAVGYDFNLGSSVQTAAVLFTRGWTQCSAERYEDGVYQSGARAGRPRMRIRRIETKRPGMGLRPVKPNDTGDGWSVGRDSLAYYQSIPAVAHMTQFREYNKLLTTYLEVWPGMLTPEGRLRTSYNSVGTLTGRLSSRNPNLQNVPVRTDLGHAIRNLFVPSPGNKLLVIDLSQVEMRLTAWLSGDPVLLAAIRDGIGVYEDLAARVGSDRHSAKTACLAQNYGAGPERVAGLLAMTVMEAKALLKSINTTWAGVDAWRSAVEKQLARDGFITLPSGRRRTPTVAEDKPWAWARARRQAVNAKPQGICADIVKRMLVESPAAPILQVHDELVWDCTPEQAVMLEAAAMASLERAAIDFGVTGIELTATAALVDRWGDAK